MKVIYTHKYWVHSKSDREVHGTSLTLDQLRDEFPNHFIGKEFRRPNLNSFFITSDLVVEVDEKEVFSATVTSFGSGYKTSVQCDIKPSEHSPTPEMIRALTEVQHSHYEALRKAEL